MHLIQFRLLPKLKKNEAILMPKNAGSQLISLFWFHLTKNVLQILIKLLFMLFILVKFNLAVLCCFVSNGSWTPLTEADFFQCPLQSDQSLKHQ